MTEPLLVERLQQVTQVTYRRIDYWVRRGYLRPANPGPGSGHARRFTADDAVLVATIDELSKLGVALGELTQTQRDCLLDEGRYATTYGAVSVDIPRLRADILKRLET